MKILFVSDTYYPHLNGVYYFVCRLAPLLEERGHQVAVIAPSETVHYTLKKIDAIDVYGIPSLPVLYYPKVRFPIPAFQGNRIKKIIRDFEPDVVHVQDHFAISKAVVHICKKLQIPVMGTNHFMTENLTALLRIRRWRSRLSDILWRSFSNVYNEVSIVTTPSETAAQLIRPKLDTDVVSISSGINLNEFNPVGDTRVIRQKYHIPQKPVILFVGRLDPEKNLEETLAAVSLALKDRDFCFVIVGKGLRKTALEEMAKNLRISDHVIFTGFVPDEELPYIYKLSNGFVISSFAELLSLSALQGMAAGLPIIAVNAGALSELIEQNVNGYLYEKGDIKSLAKCICLILEPETNKRMGIKSHEFVQMHDIRRTVISFEQLYLRIMLPPGEMVPRDRQINDCKVSVTSDVI